MQVQELTAEFGIAGVLDFIETEHGLVKAAISLSGTTGELYLQGAQVTAWQPPGDRPVLFTSPNAVFTPGTAIRGGIPIVFPWFRRNRRSRAGREHGFARTETWHLDAVETTGAEALTLTPQPRRRRCPLAILAGAVPRDLHRDLRGDAVVTARRAEPRDEPDLL